MKKVLFLAAFAVIASILTGCTSINTSDAGRMNLYPDLYKPLKAYRPVYTVDTKIKVSGEANVHVLFGIFCWGASNFADNASIFGDDNVFAKIFPSAKDISAKAAFYDACVKKKCDAILAARYEITTKDYFLYKKVNSKVTGYPATMEKIDEVRVLYFVITKDGKPEVLTGDDVYVDITPKSSSWF